MVSRKFINLLVMVSMLASLLLMSGGGQASAQKTQSPLAARSSSVSALPISPTDKTKVPHYFGPNPNWALSPFTQPDVVVTIAAPPAGPGVKQAKAEATVGANGSVTGYTITDPGSGYTALTPPSVTINNAAGTNSSATAQAQVTDTGIVSSISVSPGGSRYTAPVVEISGGGGAGAAATAYGSVDTLVLSAAGSGYTNPTVEIGLPDDAVNGVQATASITWDATTGAITGISIVNPGSGYAKAPNVTILDGTMANPINHALGAAKSARAQMEAGTLAADAINLVTTIATAKATLTIQSVSVDTFGAGYTSAPSAYIFETDPTGLGNGALAVANMTYSGAVTAISIPVGGGGSGYVTGSGIQKFTDRPARAVRPGAAGCPDCPASGKYIPVAVPRAQELQRRQGRRVRDRPGAVPDELLVVPKDPSASQGTLVRGYVQLETPANAASASTIPLANELLDGTEGPDHDQRASRRSPSPRRSGWARPSRRPRTSRSGSSSTTCCRRAPTATCSCRPTPP